MWEPCYVLGPMLGLCGSKCMALYSSPAPARAMPVEHVYRIQGIYTHFCGKNEKVDAFSLSLEI